MDNDKQGLDPNTITGTTDAIDPETGALGTAGTPMTDGYGVSGSSIGTGSVAGELEHKTGDYSGSTPDTKGYTAGTHEPDKSPEPPSNAHRGVEPS